MASQMIIPFSDDTLFIRGFSARLSNEEIRSYFVKNAGNCSVEFFKQTENRDRLFIALKFESKDVAKDVLNRYHREDVLGDRIQVSWYKDLRRARAKDYGRHYGGRYVNYGGYQGGRDRWRPQQRSRRYGHSSSRSPDRRYSTHSRSRTPSPRRHYHSDNSRSPSASSEGRSPSPVNSPGKIEATKAVGSLEGRDVSAAKTREARSEKRRLRKISQTGKERHFEEDATESKKETSAAKAERKSHKRSRHNREKVREESRTEEMDIEDAVQGKWKTTVKPTEHKAVRSRVVAVEPSDESRSPSPESPTLPPIMRPKKNGAVMSSEEGEYSTEDAVYTKPVEKKKKRRRSPAGPPPARRREYSDEFLADAEELELTAAAKTDRHRKREVQSPEEYRVVQTEPQTRVRKPVPPVEYEEDYPASPPAAVPPPAVEKLFPIGREQPVYERETHYEVESISSKSSRRSATHSAVPPVHSPSPSPIPPPPNRRKRPITDEYVEVSRRRGEGDDVGRAEVKVSRTTQDEVLYQRPAAERVAYSDRRTVHSVPEQPSSRELNNQRAAFNGGLREAERGALGLTADKLLLVKDKKADIDKAYKQDCETFAAVTKMLISKDPSMEERMQSALRDNLKDIGQRCIHELRDYIEQLRSLM